MTHTPFYSSLDVLNVSSIEEMDDLVDQLHIIAQNSYSYYSTYYVGIFFHLDDDDLVSSEPPHHLKYDLRKQDYYYTDIVYPYLQIAGPRDYYSG